MRVLLNREGIILEEQQRLEKKQRRALEGRRPDAGGEGNAG
jgi:hypothetical protein